MSWCHIEDTTPRARKRHRCHLCDGGIEPGEVHVKRYGIGDDGPVSTRMHVRCEALTRDWDEGDWESCDSATFRDEVLRPQDPTQEVIP